MGHVELDELTAEFFDAFDNRGGKEPDVMRLFRLCLQTAMIIKAEGRNREVDDLANYCLPRQRMLSNGELTEFHMWETSNRTEIEGKLAQRFSRYRQSGIRDGVRFTQSGSKTIHFVLTPAGWRITIIAWTEDPPDGAG